MNASRRHVLALVAASLAATPVRAVPAVRMVALDWGLAATAIALGAPPLGVAEQRLYAKWVDAPALPESTTELGLRATPSLETIARLRPDLILINELNAGLKSRLETIAPTYENTIFSVERAPLARSAATVRDLGARIGQSMAAEALLAEAERHFAAAAARTMPARARPVLPLAFADGRHVHVYGRGSLIDDVLRRLSLTNAWTGDTNIWGFALVPVEALAPVRDAILLLQAPLPPEARAALAGDGLWSALAAAAGNRVAEMPAVWAFGELTAAVRCANLIADALAPGAESRS